jgi:DNA helicase-2/ATP-dependent DNA helicase PcrA
MGASILRREGEKLGLGRDFTIYDDGDQISLARRVLRELNRESDAGSARDLLSAIDRHKNGIDDGPLGDDTLAAISRYQNALRAANAVDFGDLLSLPLELFETHPDVLEHYRRRFSHVLVDEFQDTNQVQYKLLKLLKPPPDANLCVVGDDDQSIYRWRGAEVGNILGFETDYPAAKVVRQHPRGRRGGHRQESAPPRQGALDQSRRRRADLGALCPGRAR